VDPDGIVDTESQDRTDYRLMNRDSIYERIVSSPIPSRSARSPRRSLGPFLIALALCAACGPQEPEKPAVDEATAAVLIDLQEHLALRNFDAGVEIGEAYLAESPQAPGVHYAVGILHLGKQNYQAAIDSLKEAVSRDPSHADGWLKLGTAHTRLGSLEEGNEALREALARVPDLSDAAFLLGKNLSRLGIYDEAQKTLLAAAAGLPAPSYFELGLLHQKTDAPEAAEEAFRSALAADPEHLGATYNLAQALIVSGRRQEGQQLMTRHSDLRQQHHELDQLRKTTLYDWATADNFVQLADYYLRNGDPVRAGENFEKALKMEAKQPGALLGLGRSYLERGDFERASPWFVRVTEEVPESPEGFFFLGISEHMQGRFESARDAFSASRERGTWGPEQYLFFGNALFQTGAFDDARQAYEEVGELAGPLTEANRRLGLIYYLDGELETAVSAWEPLAESRSDDAELWVLVGIARYRLGGAIAAKPAFDRALTRQAVTLHGNEAFEALVQRLSELPESQEALAYYRSLREG